MSVQLHTFESRHLPRLEEWLRAPHVAPWFPAPDDDLRFALDPPPGGDQRIIHWKGNDIGYLRWVRVERPTLDGLGLQHVPAGSIDADILLGVSDATGVRLGVEALHLLADHAREALGAPMIGLTTSIRNTRAQKGFENAGFVRDRTYDPDGRGPCYLMLRDLRKT